MTITRADPISTNVHTMYAEIFQVAQPNTFSIWWQVPQYLVISAAEILFSITGLVFSFTQAPLTMKSVIMAAWLVTDAIGNLIIIFIIEINFFDNQVYLYLLFAGIMFVVMIIFVLMSVFYYDYVSYIPTGNETTDADND
jgi:solute carrier family 15 oligopeptide transporter 1